ncbi:MAG: glycoside hydrolase family 3 protein [Erysipelotrichaceae bacterium]|nr:glycoside hydrolase family 3 protein [Erysipelotrichaceae bacterium]
MNIKEIVSKMTLEEKIKFCTGKDCWHIYELSQFNVPSIMMSDGPHGLRCQLGSSDMLGINKSEPATCFPTAVTAAQTFNTELIKEEGKAIAEEALSMGVSIVLGPGCNIKRNPLCGRNFEYFSEDPYLSGKMGVSWIKGLQSTGVKASLKHFATNNQEFKRQNGDSQLDEKTMREIYLKPFEMAVKESKPGTVMCCYNKVNGIHGSDNKTLLTDILRTEWGFDGLVMTDWGAMNDRIKAFQAGCDLNMPGANTYMEKKLLKAVKEGLLDEKDIDQSVERILTLIQSVMNLKKKEMNSAAHHELARKVAEEGAVLLKNEGVLPLNTDDICLIGHMAEDIRYQGTGSSHINPLQLPQLKDVLNVPYYACCDKEGAVTEDTLKQAKDLASKHKVAVVVAGLPDLYESEGFDREHLRMPEGHVKMIEAVASVNANTVVVLLGGSAMEVPWQNQVNAILYMGLPGQAGAEAVEGLLKGEVNPSGKLAETWPMTYDDVISKNTFGKKNTEYREGIYVGYRYYDKANVPVRYPFGYGLSYTTFAYSDLSVVHNEVRVSITNTGSVKGKEAVLMYVGNDAEGYHAKKELKSFTKVELEPQETKQVQFTLNDDCFQIWDKGWKVKAGTYQILVGSLSETIEVEGESVNIAADDWYVTLKGEPAREQWENLMGYKVPEFKEAVKGEFTLDNTVLEMSETSGFMRLLTKFVTWFVSRGVDGPKDMSNPTYRMMVTGAMDCPIRAMVINAGNIMNDNLAEAIVLIGNGHFFKGILKALGL